MARETAIEISQRLCKSTPAYLTLLFKLLLNSWMNTMGRDVLLRDMQTYSLPMTCWIGPSLSRERIM